MLKDISWIIVSAAVVNNFTLTLFLGLCSFLGVTSKVSTALRMGAADTFVLVLTSIAAWALNKYVLGFAPYLRIIAFIVVVAALVQIVEMFIKKVSPTLFRELGIYLPLITTNCAVLGIPLLALGFKYDFIESLLFGAGSSIGFSLALILFAGIRERIEGADVPTYFKGTAIALVTGGLMSLAFMGFAGLDKYR